MDWGFMVQPYSATTDIETYEEVDTGAVGQRSKMGDGSGSTGWRYDERGRLVDETKVVDDTPGGTFVTQYDYYANDQVKDMWYPGGNAGETGEKVTFTYHPQGLVDSVTGNNTFVKSSSYDAAGRLTRRVLGNNAITRSYSYYSWGDSNGWGRLSAMTAGTLQDLDYVYDPNGNIIQIDDNLAGSPQRQTFTYDDLDRLISASASGGSGGTYALENYLYDSTSGNLSSKAGVSYIYSNGSMPPGHNVTSTSNGWIFGYDANGNMTSRDVGTTYSLDYDVENRLISVSGGVLTASFDYDGDGNRVRGRVGSTTVVYIGDYYEWNGSTSKKYFYAGGQRAAMRDGSARKFLLDDHLGSTAVTASATGGFLAEVRYKPWGEDRYTSGTTPTTYKFTGQRQEADLGGVAGLYDYNARWYDPALGRFVQADTIVPEPGNPQAWDRYAYARNNPIKFIDPTGHTVCTPDDPCHKDRSKSVSKGIVWLFGYSPKELKRFSQLQRSDTNACAPFSMAMAINILTGKNIPGESLEAYLELNLFKSPLIGMLPENQALAMNYLFNEYTIRYAAEYTENSTTDDLLSNLRDGYLSIVNISWGTNSDIIKDVLNLQTPAVGHAMLIVGYNYTQEEYITLNPGSSEKGFYPVTASYFTSIWQGQPNYFIPAGSLITIRPR